MFIRQCLYLLSVQTRLEHSTFSCHLLYVSVVFLFGRHRVDFIVTYTEKNTEVDMKDRPPTGYIFSCMLL